MTRPDGPAIRGSRRSRGSRSGLAQPGGGAVRAVTASVRSSRTASGASTAGSVVFVGHSRVNSLAVGRPPPVARPRPGVLGPRPARVPRLPRRLAVRAAGRRGGVLPIQGVLVRGVLHPGALPRGGWPPAPGPAGQIEHFFVLRADHADRLLSRARVNRARCPPIPAGRPCRSAVRVLVSTWSSIRRKELCSAFKSKSLTFAGEGCRVSAFGESGTRHPRDRRLVTRQGHGRQKHPRWCGGGRRRDAGERRDQNLSLPGRPERLRRRHAGRPDGAPTAPGTRTRRWTASTASTSTW